LCLLVLSADIGQIALKQAEQFNNIVGLNGIIITKMDGSAKGGGALAACTKLKIPVFFIANGEKIEDLQKFDSTRYLSQIMGYGDLQGLLEKIDSLKDEDLENITEFNFNTYKKQLKMTSKIGGFTKLAGMLGIGKIPKDAMGLAEDKMKQFNYMIDSMTPYERTHPEVLTTNRLQRIAIGSGTKLEDVRLLIKQFNMMSETMNKFKDKNPEDLGKEDLQKVMQKEMQKKMKKKFKLK